MIAAPILVIVIVVILIVLVLIVVVFIRKWSHTSTYSPRILGKLCLIQCTHAEVIILSFFHAQLNKESSNDEIHEEEHCTIILRDIVIKTVPEKDLVLGSQLQLKEIAPSQRYFIRCHISENCSLKEYVDGCGLTFKRGCTLYEFKYVEDISADKEVILTCEVSLQIVYYVMSLSIILSQEEGIPKYFSPISKDSLLGEGVLPPTLENHRVFIQSEGSGVTHLQANTDLLYIIEV